MQQFPGITHLLLYLWFPGNASVAALNCRRIAVCVVEGEEVCTMVFTQLSQVSRN